MIGRADDLAELIRSQETQNTAMRDLIRTVQMENESLRLIAALFQNLEAKVLRLELMFLPEQNAEEGDSRGRN